MSEKTDAGVGLLDEVVAAGLPTPEIEVRFHPTRRWRFDFAWSGPRIAVEIEGGTYTGGRHTTGPGYWRDCEKYNEAALAGWLVIRVIPGMVRDGRAIEWVLRAYRSRQDYTGQPGRAGDSVTATDEVSRTKRTERPR